MEVTSTVRNNFLVEVHGEEIRHSIIANVDGRILGFQVTEQACQFALETLVDVKEFCEREDNCCIRRGAIDYHIKNIISKTYTT